LGRVNGSMGMFPNILERFWIFRDMAKVKCFVLWMIKVTNIRANGRRESLMGKENFHSSMGQPIKAHLS